VPTNTLSHRLASHLFASSPLILPQTLPNTLPRPPPKLLRLLTPLLFLLPPQPCSLHIRRTLIIRAMQQTNHTKQNRLRRLHGAPPLRRAFITILVIFRRMQDANAHEAIRVYIWVEGDGREESHGRRGEGVGGGKGEAGGEVCACVFASAESERRYKRIIQEISKAQM
jgi:hypothetical protein